MAVAACFGEQALPLHWTLVSIRVYRTVQPMWLQGTPPLMVVLSFRLPLYCRLPDSPPAFSSESLLWSSLVHQMPLPAISAGESCSSWSPGLSCLVRDTVSLRHLWVSCTVCVFPNGFCGTTFSQVSFSQSFALQKNKAWIERGLGWERNPSNCHILRISLSLL